MRKYLAVALLLISGASFADFDSALEHYQKENFAEAYQSFFEMAKMGEKRSQFNLGVMYYYGQHIEQDINKAYAWLKLATESESAEEGEKQAFNTISKQIQDLDKAETAYRALADKYASDKLIEKLYPVLIEPEGDASFTPKVVKQVPPKYPTKAARAGLEGWVRLQFDIDPTGAPRNIFLLESHPKKIFVDSSVKALKQWRFEARADEESIKYKQRRYLIRFRLKDSNGIETDDKLYRNTLALAKQGNAVAQYKIGYWNTQFFKLSEKQNPSEWFLKAAVQGVPQAQYAVGRSLVLGQGCLSDKTKGIEWLTRAASADNKEAKQYLALLALQSNSKDSQINASDLLSNIEKLEANAQIEYAWMLATSPYPEVNDPQKAIKLANDLPHKTFWDEATEYEIKAAAYAAMNNYKKAIDMQEKALEEAQDLGVDLNEIKNRLEAYRQGTTWF